MRTLLIMPHMDDEAISCAGLIQDRVERGWNVHVLFLFNRLYDYGREVGTAELVDARTAKSILRYHWMEFSEHHEGEPGISKYYPILKDVEDYMRVFRPTEIVGPSPRDLNQDHHHLSHAVDIAMRPINQGLVARHLQFIGLDGITQQPNYFIPMDRDMLGLKQRAVAAYAREARSIPSPRAPENLEAQARVWGSMCAAEFAEGYECKMIKEPLP